MDKTENLHHVLKNAEERYNFLRALCYKNWHHSYHILDWIQKSLTGTIIHIENIITDKHFPADQIDYAQELIWKYKGALATFMCINNSYLYY